MSRSLSLLNLPFAELSILFVNDRGITDLNKRYRNIDETTDVLSFPMYEGGPKGEDFLLGDIVVNLHMAGRRADEANGSIEDETLKLLIHGLLHLIGYDHERGKADAKKMFKREEELIDAVKKLDRQP